MSSQNIENWYAIYTKSKAEQTLKNGILMMNQQHKLSCETYLPLITETRVWKDRIKTFKKPLFKNYLFVKHDERAFCKIKYIKGFDSYVKAGLNPTVIPEQQMQLIKKTAALQIDTPRPISELRQGQRVEIIRGALSGCQGVLLEDFKSKTLAIEIASLQLFLTVKLPVSDVVLLA